MNQKQKVRILSGIFLAAIFFTTLPLLPLESSVVSAQIPESALESDGYSGLIPCGRSGAQGEASQPCTACHAVVGIKRATDYLMGIMVVVAIAVIVAMGILYILSGVSTDLKKKSKAGLSAVFFGLVFMLSAWLIVNTILRFMANEQFINGGGGFIGLMPGDGAYGLKCSTESDAGSATLTAGQVRSGTGSYAGGAAGSGKCAPIQNAGNPCSVENLKKNPCWAGLGDTVVAQASGICNAESQGIPGVRSGSTATDHCGCATCPVVSQGLFQVNITAHYEKVGCPKIAQPPLTKVVKYSSSVWYDPTCKIIASPSEVNACINKVADSAWNINYACQLYKQRNGWGDWQKSFTEKCNSFK